MLSDVTEVASVVSAREKAPSLLGADSGVPDIGKYALPLVMGSVQQLRSVSFGDNTDAQITLIARRSTQRPGVRHWRRGADAEVRPPCFSGQTHTRLWQRQAEAW